MCQEWLLVAGLKGCCPTLFIISPYCDHLLWYCWRLPGLNTELHSTSKVADRRFHPDGWFSGHNKDSLTEFPVWKMQRSLRGRDRIYRFRKRRGACKVHYSLYKRLILRPYSNLLIWPVTSKVSAMIVHFSSILWTGYYKLVDEWKQKEIETLSNDIAWWWVRIVWIGFYSV